MKKFLLTLVILFSIFSINSTHAQTQSSESLELTLTRLTDRVSTLEHELEYLKLESQLNTLLSNINFLSNQIHIYAIGLEIHIHHNDYDKKLYKSSNKLYDTFIEQHKSIQNEISSYQSWVRSKLITYPFYESEQKLLQLKLDNIDKAEKRLNGTIDFYKLALDLYKKNL